MSRILVVDDEPSIREFIHAVLSAAGFGVATAADGEEALDVPGPFDLLLTDVMMPILDGLALCRAIQSHPAYQAIPVVVMSAIIDPPAADGCRASGFLKKPFDLQRLVDTITNAIGLADHA